LLRPVVRTFAARYGVEVAEAEQGLGDYATFEEFFIRRLRPGVRPVQGGALLSPCDGTAHGLAVIRQGELYRAKGRSYRYEDLLGPLRGCGRLWEGGQWVTLYLSPRDYHRFHAPCGMRVRRVAHLPGRRWPVNGWAVRRLPGLFVENERLVVVAETDQGWSLGMVFVAALNVGWIHLHGVPLAGERTAPTVAEVSWSLQAGEEMGYFSLGSTILLLLPPEAPPIRPLRDGEPIQVGSVLAPWPPAGR
jgi:phosphatidylserine decarboxylase